ncbi:hypothetical protein [Thermomonospora umbrina]|uniref:Uncharacterized protein n=1 Tax=Thermomonospora umbrina TaxID=111806 RepID=A0A3D9T5V3_9ACTN|nr:hypothetical protein [Thermomonospora umbrina]REE99151.1 hypothetical protein DFJ69_4658 [Thermomonospora umbrina]
MPRDHGVPADDHAAEVEALNRRYPRWTIWFGLFTRSWWALPPREQGLGGFVEAETPQRLVARIENHRSGAVIAEVRRSAAPPRPPVPAQPPHPGTGPVPTPARYGTRPDPRPDSRHDVRRPSNLLRLEADTPPPARRVPAVAWPGGPAR